MLAKSITFFANDSSFANSTHSIWKSTGKPTTSNSTFTSRFTTLNTHWHTQKNNNTINGTFGKHLENRQSLGYRSIHLSSAINLPSESLWDFNTTTASVEPLANRTTTKTKKDSTGEKKASRKTTSSKDAMESRPKRALRSTSKSSLRPSSKKTSSKSASKSSSSTTKDPRWKYGDASRKSEPFYFNEDKLPISQLRHEASKIEKVSREITPMFTEHYVKIPREAQRRYPPPEKTVRPGQLVSQHQLRKEMLETILPTISITGLNSKLLSPGIASRAVVRPHNATDDDQVQRAKLIAAQLELPYFDTSAKVRLSGANFALVVNKDIISLSNLEDPHSPNVYSDLITGATEHRKKTGGIDPKSPIMRAVKVAEVPTNECHILDATGGLGVDAFMFACFGYNVTILERNPLVYTLLFDAIQRAGQVEHLSQIISRITLLHEDAYMYLPKLNKKNAPDVIYLDPMYPIPTKMTASPKKGMALARALVGQHDEADGLVRVAVQHAKHKVVLKRPYYAADSAGTNSCFKSRSLRFEVFTKESWEKVGPSSAVRVVPSHRKLTSSPFADVQKEL